jgi:hypothetical protein
VLIGKAQKFFIFFKARKFLLARFSLNMRHWTSTFTTGFFWSSPLRRQGRFSLNKGHLASEFVRRVSCKIYVPSQRHRAQVETQWRSQLIEAEAQEVFHVRVRCPFTPPKKNLEAKDEEKLTILYNTYAELGTIQIRAAPKGSFIDLTKPQTLSLPIDKYK